jgi:exoribonuclease R
VLYAIADLSAFVTAGDPVDVECHKRVETLYSPDERTPLHPTVLGEGAASLLPDEVRPALVWQLDLDDAGELVASSVRRAKVRSVDRLDYAEVQRRVDAGKADERLQLLAEVGPKRLAIEQARGGVRLALPEQEVEATPDGFRLAFRTPMPVEGWNEQISLLTGMAAAKLMLDAKVGVLRTLPPAPDFAIQRLHRVAKALSVAWPRGESYAAFISGLDPSEPASQALLQEATVLLRGAGYTAFDGEPPEQPEHAALAAAYAHVTAPLRRLVDRYAEETCLAISAGQPVPDWVRSALPALPDEMAASDKRASELERACIDLVEAVLLHRAVGQKFAAVVVETDRDGGGGTVLLRQPAVRAKCDGDLPLGELVTVTLNQADPSTRTVRFALA